MDCYCTNTKFLAEISALGPVVLRSVLDDYLAYTVKIGELATRFTWALVLLYDDDYRRRQAEMDFCWGSDAPHLSMVILKERPSSQKPGGGRPDYARQHQKPSFTSGRSRCWKGMPVWYRMQIPSCVFQLWKKSQPH